MTSPHFVIWAPGWDETSGGVVALHALCARMNGLGIRAALWPDTKPALQGSGFARTLRYGLSYLLRGRRRFARGPFPNPIARARDLRTAVVVYPEIVGGNPLGAARVVRWLLHRPGHHTGRFSSAPGDLIFFYQAGFADAGLGLDDTRQLRVTHLNPAYRQTNSGPRVGSAYMVRKGAGRTLDRHPPDAVRVDGVGHEELAAVCNRVATFYSYDPYTLYSLYAAMCGADSVILPEDGVTLEQCFPGGRPPGVAYGEDDLEYGRRTRTKLILKIEADLREEDQMIRRFAATCAAWFETRAEARRR